MQPYCKTVALAKHLWPFSVLPKGCAPQMQEEREEEWYFPLSHNRELKGHYGKKGLYIANKCFATKDQWFMYIKDWGGEASIGHRFQFRDSTVESGSMVIARTLFWESTARCLLLSLSFPDTDSHPVLKAAHSAGSSLWSRKTLPGYRNNEPG